MPPKIPIETSARHIHISKEDFETLFGEGKELTFVKELSQPGQYLAAEKLAVIGPRGEFERVSILGPFRSKTQVEISVTDARKLGVPSVIRQSGDIAGSPGCILRAGENEIQISEGVIVAKRHIHMTTQDANEMGLVNGQIVEVKVTNDVRSTTFGDVVVRVRDDFALAMHIDTDESNAACVAPGTYGEIIK